MKQELITNFLMQRSSKLSIEDSIKIQNLLRSTADEAYPILMAAKTFSNIWKILLYIISVVLLLFFCSWAFEAFDTYPSVDWEGLEIAIPFLIGAIAALIGATSIKLRKKRMFENYLRIILAYQIN